MNTPLNSATNKQASKASNEINQLHSPTEPLRKNISDSPRAVLFALAFRAFFLFGTLWAVIAIAIWSLWFSGKWTLTFAMPPTLWHAHEMIFGFAACVAAGFLLTAVQTWTGLRSINGLALMGLTLLWVIARTSLLFGDTPVSIIVFSVAQFSWWFGVVGFFSYLIIKSKNTANRVLILLLVGMFSLNALFVIMVLKQEYALASHLSQSAIVLFCALISLVGGRVIPFFTARGLTQKQYKNPLLDNALFWLSLITTGVFAAQFFADFTLQTSGLLIMLACGHLWRLWRWYHPGIWQVPLLWSLHLAYFAMAIGLLLVSISLLTSLLALKDALHLISISAVSGMILSMMSRVSLGHTGRVLKVSVSLNGAFALLLLAGFVRAFSALTPHVVISWQLSAGLWLTAFVLFLWHYLPVLIRARVDGKPD
ncbi:NnrS family protein [Paraglaciecola sp. 20A4]|uniref:NnrS family protein n=1 Tax=Paraglaciecola sp. 20A4 TaxID=2687288 RepID=UPI00140CBE14|nr:NnrS family protein [Paraglaciecola sp. 20A4]